MNKGLTLLWTPVGIISVTCDTQEQSDKAVEQMLEYRAGMDEDALGGLGGRLGEAVMRKPSCISPSEPS